VTENPAVGATEVSEMYNTTGDAHPMHIHEITFEVVNRQEILVNEETVLDDPDATDVSVGTKAVPRWSKVPPCMGSRANRPGALLPARSRRRIEERDFVRPPTDEIPEQWAGDAPGGH
jgi:FtsP/CotA-like multicopper oxidase with cupredoxin domain